MKHQSAPRSFAGFAGLLRLVLVPALLLPGAMAATFTVDTTIDEFNTPSGATLSLREAIRDANVTPADDTINLSAGIYTLTRTGSGEDACATGDLDVVAVTPGGTLTIRGAGAAATVIDAAGESGLGDRVLQLLENAHVTIEDLALSGGRASGTDHGGGIYSHSGALIVIRCAISGNSVVGATRDGGGIYSWDSVLAVTDSTISGNSAANSGGGICNLGVTLVTVTRSTISGNSATSGGGVFNYTGSSAMTTSIDSSTIAGNTATGGGGGIYNFNGRTRITYCTIAGNAAPDGAGGGVASHGDPDTETWVAASIIAGNSGSDVDLVVETANNSFTSGGDNLIGSGNATGVFSLPGDTTGTDDPRLTPLGHYGGPTQTMHPLAASPAINAAGVIDPGGADQRGFSRFVDGHLDIGAVEAGPAMLVTNLNDAGPGSLRQALLDATVPGQRILFQVVALPFTIVLTSGPLVIDGGRCLFIDASPTLRGVTIDARHNSSVLSVEGSTTTAAFHSFIITDGRSYGSGGAILNHLSTLTLIHSTVTNSFGNGGGIANLLGTLAVTHSTISGNFSIPDGGGICNQFGTLTVTHSTIAGNTAYGHGGGIYNFLGRTEITRCTIAGNTAWIGEGSGVASWGDSATETVVSNSIIAGNTRSDADLVNSTSINSFTSAGHNLIGFGTATDSTDPLRSNAFDQPGDTIGVGDPLLAPLGHYGGPTETMHPLADSPAIDPAGGLATVAGTDQRGFPRVVDGNGDSTDLVDVGAVEAGPVRLVTTTADDGFGSLRAALISPDTPCQRILFYRDVFPATIGLESELVSGPGHCVFIDASNIPSGVTLDAQGNSRVLTMQGTGTTVALHSLTITGGAAGGGNGGGIFNSATLTVADSTVSGNSATSGGGIYSNGIATTVAGSTITGNTAGEHGGGIYTIDASFADPLTVTRSTISGNSAGLNGGGIFSDGTPSRLMTTITASTIAGNTATGAGGGIDNFEGITRITHCTITGNTATDGYGSGVASWGNTAAETVVLNSLIAGNTNSDADLLVYTGNNSFTSFGHNMIGSGNATGTNPPISNAFTQPGDTTGIANPLLAPLGDFGGPTHMMPPVPGSPAIEGAAMGPFTPGTDQRGQPRPIGPLPDIGAVEAFPFSSLPLLDTDGDGIDDRLEGPGGCYPHLTKGHDDSGLDTDGDGRSDADELADMTDLFDPTDYFRILSFTPHPTFDPGTNPLFTITLETFPGLKYEFETNQFLDGAFTPLPDSGFTAADFTTTFDILLAPWNDCVRARRK